MKNYRLVDKVRKSRVIISATLLLAALAFAEAAEADDVPNLPSIKTDGRLAAMVPKFYRDKGTIIAAVNPDLVPIKFVNDDGDITGFTPDLLKAASDVLNLKVQITQASFDALIPGMSAGRFDVLVSLADFTSRHSVVTFVDYLNMGETVVASPGKQISLKSLDELCGLRVALPRGSATIPESAKISDKCVSDGKKPLTVATYPDSSMALLSLSTGISEVAWIDSPIGYYNASKFPSKYKIVYFTAKAPYGIGFGVDEKGKQLAGAMQQALLKLKRDGIYDMLIKKWGLSPKDGKPLFPINGAQL